MAFKHIDFLEKLVKRAEQSDTPWDAFQEKESGKDWVDLTSFPVLKDSSEYRPKPAAIEVNGIEFDEPVDYQLPDGTEYYTPDLYNSIIIPLSSILINLIPFYLIDLPLPNSIRLPRVA